MRVSLVIAAMSLGVLTSAATGQQMPPLRQLGPFVATTPGPLGSTPSVRALSDGRVLVSDAARRQLLMFDSTLTRSQPILTPSGAAANVFPAQGGTLFALPGDTTLLLDAAGASFIVIDPAGKVSRVISVPRASDTFILATTTYGMPTIDDRMRLIYRKRLPPTGFSIVTGNAIYPDSSPILAVGFDTRRADTLGYMKVPGFAPSISTVDLAGRRHFTTIQPPFELTDEWAALPNGTVAIIRWRDYHVDWINPDGTRESSPKTAWSWVRMSDDEKARFIDSLKVVLQKNDSLSQGQMMMFGGSPSSMPVLETMTVAPSEVPDYPPPFVGKATRVDREGRIWVLERAQIGAPPAGLIYDIIDRSGQIVDRVQLPLNAAVVGFGPNGNVYMSITPSNMALAASIPPVVSPTPGSGMGGGAVKLGRAVLARP